MKRKTLNEFEAAQLLKLSPDFLRWCTSYAPKGDGVKLKCRKEDGIFYFYEDDLFKFDAHLSTPWPLPAKSQRPSLPTGISDEIKREALYRCPVCNTNLGEIAHIKPVAKTLNNHPHNLIFLCPNHHTQYDFGYRTKNVSEDDVLGFKDGLQRFQSIIWSLKARTIDSYLFLISRIEKLKLLEEDFNPNLADPGFEKVLGEIVHRLKAIGTRSVKESTKTKRKPRTDAISRDGRLYAIVKSVETADTDKNAAYSYLTVKEKLEAEYTIDPTLKLCPLCAGNGCTVNFETCPVCIGDCYIAMDREIDISAYRFQNCRLCKGKGYTADFDTCPPCHGQGQLIKEQADNIDFSQFDFVDCRLCKGKGYTSDFDTCPPCQGAGRLTKEQEDNTDFSQFDFVDCRLCKGKGYTRDSDPCNLCNGEGRIIKGVQ